MLILGIGNSLLQDEGIGIYLLKFMEKHFPSFPDVTYRDGSCLDFNILSEIEAHNHLLILAAVELYARPGTVCCYQNEAMDRFLGTTAKRSDYDISLLELLGMARLSGHLPANRALVGLQYSRMGMVNDISIKVKHNIPLAARLAATVVQQWELQLHPPCGPWMMPPQQVGITQVGINIAKNSRIR